MTTTKTNLNKFVANPDLKSLLDLWKQDVFTSLNCHAIGTIQEFDETNQLAQITLNYKKTVNGKESSYPILIDCPVVILSGGQAKLTFPIAVGDSCVVLFNDRCIDDWWNGGQVAPLSSERMHSFADAIALVGIRSTLNAIADYDTTRAVLSYGDTLVGVGATKVKVANAGTTLNTLLQTLITDLTTLNTDLTAFATTVATDPIATVTAGAATTLLPLLTTFASSLSTLSTQIGDLLE